MKPWTTLCTILILKSVESRVNFCHNGFHALMDTHITSVIDVRKEYHCPGGLLFRNPQTIHAIQANPNTFCFQSDICSEHKWKCGRQRISADVQLLVNYQNDSYEYHELLSNDDFRLSHFTPHCSPLPLKADGSEEDSSHAEDDNLVRKKRQTISLDDEKNYNMTNEIIRAELTAQTKRIFYYLGGINPELVFGNTRAVAMLELSADIIRGSCDPMFLSSKFVERAMNGFLFILKEQGAEKVIDPENEVAQLLFKALDQCVKGDTSLKLTGSRCALDLSVDTIQKKDSSGGAALQAIKYKPNFDTFMWGKYDVIIDAVWHIIDFVHGMCFTTFNDNINMHHAYQTTMEELFRSTVHIRWSRPTKLLRDNLYDNMLMASVNDSMTVLDACVQGAYIGSPFQHRLKRPIQEENLSRKRRELKTEESANGLMDVAYCLQSEEEQNYRINELRQEQCN